MAQFLVVSLPFEAAGGLSHEDEREKTYRTLRHVTETQQDLCVNYRVRIFEYYRSVHYGTSIMIGIVSVYGG